MANQHKTKILHERLEFGLQVSSFERVEGLQQKLPLLQEDLLDCVDPELRLVALMLFVQAYAFILQGYLEPFAEHIDEQVRGIRVRNIDEVFLKVSDHVPPGEPVEGEAFKALVVDDDCVLEVMEAVLDSEVVRPSFLSLTILNENACSVGFSVPEIFEHRDSLVLDGLVDDGEELFELLVDLSAVAEILPR